MASYDIHVSHQSGTGWTVQQPDGSPSKCYGQFRVRAHAEAFGRALAHRSKVCLVVHQTDGTEARYPASALSYPVRLT